MGCWFHAQHGRQQEAMTSVRQFMELAMSMPEQEPLIPGNLTNANKQWMKKFQWQKMQPPDSVIKLISHGM